MVPHGLAENNPYIIRQTCRVRGGEQNKLRYLSAYYCSQHVGNNEARRKGGEQERQSQTEGMKRTKGAPSAASSIARKSRLRRVVRPSDFSPRNRDYAFLALVASAVFSTSHAADLATEYLKPTVSSKDCMEVVGLISAKTESIGNDGACMQCDPANKVCPPGCQALVDELYTNCDGVTTPDGLFFDPDNVIEGEWSDKIKAKIKIATERCGCDGTSRLAPTGGPFETRLQASVGLVVLTSLASWFLAVSLLMSRCDHR